MSNQNIASLISSDAASLTLMELIHKPITTLRSVSNAAATTLEKIFITTILDLAASSIFTRAKQISEASQPGSQLNTFGELPDDMVDMGGKSVPLSELWSEDISILRGIDPDIAKLLKKALLVNTIRDLSLWPPYLAALTIVNQVYQSQEMITGDPEMPQDLIPRIGQLPTERVQYRVILFDRILDDKDRSKPLVIGRRPIDMGAFPKEPVSGFQTIETSGPLEIPLSNEVSGFSKPALGAIMTITQSWFTHGLALGQLLHTVALAPGESTRIAMIDWSHSEFGSAQDTVNQSEVLVSDLNRNRSINEVIKSVATESQNGFSNTSGGGFGTGSGEGGGGAGTLDLTGKWPLKAGAVTGQSLSTAISYGGASSFASSAGKRDINAEMTQKVIDNTHQSSSSVRNRIATRVVEISQKESEGVSTRALTNYNHMHALSIQYFEVVQLYRIVVETTRVEACLFIPMKPFNFHDPAVRERFKRIIGIAALTSKVQQQAQTTMDRIAISAPNRKSTWSSDNITGLTNLFGGQSVGSEKDTQLIFPLVFYPTNIGFEFYKSPDEKRGELPFDILEIEDGNGTKSYDVKSITGSTRSMGVDGDFYVSFDDAFKTDGSTDSPFWNVKEIRLIRTKGKLDVAGTIYCTLAIDVTKQAPRATGPVSYKLWVNIDVRANENANVVFKMQRANSATLQNQDVTQSALDERDFEEQLVNNSLYYSQVIWASLDATTLGMVLSNYTFRGRPLIELVDPLPVSISGNYLAFRMHGQEDTEWWKSFLQEKGLNDRKRREDLIPMPTGGVFGEAVLGRFNSAEKLDITRFWNWQDSPIPITAPEIAAINTGTRTQPMDLKTGDLNAPVVTISNPPAIPDPQGLTAALTALANGNMFRDMSGLAGTIGFAQAAMQAATQAGIAYGQQSSQNAATAADLLAKMYGKGGTGGVQGADGVKPSPTSPATISNAGGRINYGEKLDRQNQDNPSASGSSSGGGENGASSTEGLSTAAKDAYYTDLGGYQGSADIVLAGGKGGGGGAGALILSIVPEVYEKIKDLVTASGGSFRFIGPQNVNILAKGYDDPMDYYPGDGSEGDYSRAEREIAIKLSDIGGDGPGTGLNGTIYLKWIDQCILHPTTNYNFKQTGVPWWFDKDVWFKTNIRLLGDPVPGQAIKSGEVSVKLAASGLIRSPQPRIIVQFSLNINTVPSSGIFENRINEILYGELNVNMMKDPIGLAHYTVRRIGNSGSYEMVRSETI